MNTRLPFIIRYSWWRDNRLPRVLAALGLLAIVAGCGGDETVPVYPVSGQVLVQGEPPAGAFVVFHPKDGSGAAEQIKPSAQVKADGSFRLSTYDVGDGAPQGSYNVTVEWRPLIKKDGDVQPGPNVVSPDYTRPETTPLKVEVQPGENTLKPFEVARAKTATRTRTQR